MEEEYYYAGRGQGRVFRDPAIKAEMIALRDAGYSYKDIAIKYGVDHTTIIYHCRKAKMVVFGDPVIKKEMLDRVRSGGNIDEIAAHYGVNRTVIESYCHRSGIKGVSVTRTHVRLFPKAIQVYEETLPIAPVDEPEEIRPGWRRDEKGDWICLGKSKKEAKADAKTRAQKEIQKRRIDMLTY